jgi:hypothetical protein
LEATSGAKRDAASGVKWDAASGAKWDATSETKRDSRTEKLGSEIRYSLMRESRTERPMVAMTKCCSEIRYEQVRARKASAWSASGVGAY